ncbi:MAG: type I-E CRISPR-associated protein Cse2/CasB [Spirochaetia bacterium]|nr:type I-E CRISPR-associated protein Cse2/CasB [Spirochaetia bacterium]
MRKQIIENNDLKKTRKKNQYLQKNKAFVQRLKDLSAAELAILRRCNKNPLEEPRLFSVLGKLGALNNYNHALIGCLFAVYHKAEELPKYLENYNFGKAFRNAYDPKNEKADIRFRAILTASSRDTFTYRFRQAVRLMKSKDEPIDFSELLSDLNNWSNMRKFIQRKWAEGYYQGFHDHGEEANKNLDDETGYDTEEDYDDEN